MASYSLYAARTSSPLMTSIVCIIQIAQNIYKSNIWICSEVARMSTTSWSWSSRPGPRCWTCSPFFSLTTGNLWGTDQEDLNSRTHVAVCGGARCAGVLLQECVGTQDDHNIVWMLEMMLVLRKYFYINIINPNE